jgi:hypothetical protein
VATPLELEIQLPIIEVLIGDMFFHPDNQGGTTQKNALSLFKHVNSEINGGQYKVIITNREQFSLVVRQLSRGVSFRQCVDIHNDIRDVLGITFKNALSNSNRDHENWNPHRHEGLWVCKNCPCTQSPAYHRSPRSSK